MFQDLSFSLCVKFGADLFKIGQFDHLTDFKMEASAVLDVGRSKF